MTPSRMPEGVASPAQRYRIFMRATVRSETRMSMVRVYGTEGDSVASINALWAIVWVLVAALVAAAGLWRRIHC